MLKIRPGLVSAALCGVFLAFISSVTGILFESGAAEPVSLLVKLVVLIIFYLIRRGRSIKFAVVPAALMTIIPAYALLWKMFHEGGWLNPTAEGAPNYLLAGFGFAILGLQVWMLIEALILFPRVKGVLEEALPPLQPGPTDTATGPNC